MKFPHAVEILRPAGTDAYGNENAGWSAPARTATVAFIVQKGATSEGAQQRINLALFAPDTDVRASDRVQHGAVLYEVVGDVVTASSPSKAVIKTATLRVVLGA